MSGTSWFVGVICGIVICIASIPYTVSYARYQDFNLRKAYTAEVKKTIPYAVREYLKNKPWHAFFIKYFQAQPDAEEFGAKMAAHIIKYLIPENEEVYFYIQMFVNVVLPQQFKQFHAEPVVEILSKSLG